MAIAERFGGRDTFFNKVSLGYLALGLFAQTGLSPDNECFRDEIEGHV
jgi:hypothetical protein